VTIRQIINVVLDTPIVDLVLGVFVFLIIYIALAKKKGPVGRRNTGHGKGYFRVCLNVSLFPV